MKLEKKSYKSIDILKLSFEIDLITMSLHTVLVLFNSFIPTAAMAVSTAYFVDTALLILSGEKVYREIYIPLAILLGIIGFITIVGSLLDMIQVRLKFNLERKLMPAILDVRAKLDYKYIEDSNSWELVERVGDEIVEVFLQGIRSYGMIITCVVSILFIGGLIFIQIWWTALVVGLFSVPLFLISFWAGQRNYSAKIETRKYERRYSYYSDEVLTNREAIEERSLFGYTNAIADNYSKDFEKARFIQLRVLLKTRMGMKLTSISLVVILIVIALLFIDPLIKGEVSPGMFTGIITALFGMVDTLGWQLQDASKDLTEVKEYMRDLTDLMSMDCTEGATDLPDKKPLVFESLEFIDVSFKYPSSEEYTLENLSFKLEKEKHYAFVGENGAGKTTITKLLTRLYDTYEGQILLNGKDFREFKSSSVKALFSIVYQDFSRYQISVADNIALGNISNCNDKNSLNEIASKAGLDETLLDLENGIDSYLGRLKATSVDISGGQWQRVAFARSLFSPAPVKVFDEPTSALDPIAENRMYQEFEKLMAGKTTIFISHRLGSTKLADEILVLGHGRIVEKGTHNELLKQEGNYSRMFESQREWYL